jgi:hypothetical protein
MIDLIHPIFIIVVVVELLVFAIVWLRSMYIAFTQGDDSIARFGRRILRKKDEAD